jgi:hypothetical protein
MRGSPSLVGRGIANPMSERTRGFEILFSFPASRRQAAKDSAKIPLPAPFLFIISALSVSDNVLQKAARFLLFLLQDIPFQLIMAVQSHT